MPSSIVEVARPAIVIAATASPSTWPGYQSELKPSASARSAWRMMPSRVPGAAGEPDPHDASPALRRYSWRASSTSGATSRGNSTPAATERSAASVNRRDVGVLVAVQRVEFGPIERPARPPQHAVDVLAERDGAVLRDRRVGLGQTDAPDGDAVLVADGLRRIAGELDQRLDGRWLTAADPPVEMVQRGVVERRDGDAVHLLHDRLWRPELALVLRRPHVHRLDRRRGTFRPTPSTGTGRCRAGGRRSRRSLRARS